MKKHLKQITIIAVMLILSISTQAQWTKIGIDIDGEATNDNSGYSVSLSADGSVVAIGAPHNSGNGIESGHVRIYENIAGTWTQIGTDIDGEALGDESGCSVSLSADGSIVAIGAYENDANDTTDSKRGNVRIFENIAGTWTQIGTDIDGEAAYDYSGWSVSLSANGLVVAIGALYNDGNGGSAGHVRIYKDIAGTWTQIGSDIDGESVDDRSGYSISLSADGSVVAIGAYSNDGNGNMSGHARIYQDISGTWTQIGVDIDGESVDDRSGWSVSLSADGSTVAIGAPQNAGNGYNAGHVRIYKNITGTWTQIGSDIDGEALGDGSGYSVCLSTDGSVVAIGAPYNNNGGGSDAGHVRIYKNIAGIWTKLGFDLDGEAKNDYYGGAVSICSSGYTIAIGAESNDANGVDAGHVRTYTCNSYATINPVACDTFLSFTGKKWTSSGTYFDSIPNAMGCDSIITVNLTINYSNTGDTTAIVCDSLVWYGTPYYASAFPMHTLMNVAGCDSVVTLDLTVNYSNTGDTNVVTCDSMVWYGTTYYASAMPTHTFTNVAGCDSVVTLDLTINNNTGDTTAVVCDSMAWYGTTYYASAFPTHTFINAAGCDSVVTLDLTVNYATTGTDVQSACYSYLWIDGNTYNLNNNTATHTLTGVLGCDSLVTLDLTINTVDVSVTSNNATLTANQTGADYQWIFCSSLMPIAGATNQSFSPIVNGYYAVIIDDGNCIDTSSCYTITGVGIDNFNNTSVNIYPNPTSGKLSIQCKNMQRVEILDITGKIHYEKAVTSNTHNIDISTYSKGIYFIKVTTTDATATERIILE